MSKYYKAEDVTELINACEWRMTLAKERHGEGFVDYSKQVLDVEELTKRLSKLPTIEVCEDAISRATALEIYSDLYWIDERLLNFKSELDKVYDELRNAPSVVPKPKEGEWLLDGRCSNCLQAPLTTHKNFCPNCGTKMKGGR